MPGSPAPTPIHSVGKAVQACTLEPDAEGTTRVNRPGRPKLLKTLDAMFTPTDRHVERALATHRQGIEASR